MDSFRTYYIIGIYSASSFSVIAGLSVHLITAISIGWSILSKTDILNISKLSNGIIRSFGRVNCIYCFLYPVYQFVLTRQTAVTMNGIRATTSMQQQRQQPQQPQNDNSTAVQ
ncbi:MAG: hypothetical protein ACTHME_08290 [Candidatus Nitrosocosmicus sp.]